MIEKMVEEGIDIARFKFSHGTPQAHAEVLTTLRKVGAEIVTPPK
jgi:pyruvate kinase